MVSRERKGGGTSRREIFYLIQFNRHFEAVFFIFVFYIYYYYYYWLTVLLED